MNPEFVVGDIDVAEICIVSFFLFFAGLVFYLRREDRREGYPLEADSTGALEAVGASWHPTPKTFILPHGAGVVYKPNDDRDRRDLKARRIAVWPGAPIEPVGDPMQAGVGPGSYAMRADKPDLTMDGRHRIVPMRLSHGFEVNPRDPDPRGMPVMGAKGGVAGVVREIWVDQAEMLIRYLEVELSADIAPGGRRVLVPMTMVEVQGRRGVKVAAITAQQFAGVPGTASPESITRLEEEKICAYFGAGYLYATPDRLEPLL